MKIKSEVKLSMNEIENLVAEDLTIKAIAARYAKIVFESIEFQEDGTSTKYMFPDENTFFVFQVEDESD